MIHMAHPATPEVVAEADEGRAAILRDAGWLEVKNPEPDKK